MASYSVSSTSTSITFTVTGLTSGQLVEFYIRYNDSSTAAVVEWEDRTASGSRMTATFSVPSNREYAVNIRVDKVRYEAQYIDTYESGPTRPDDWYWYSTVSRNQPIKISAREWNDFKDRVNEFREYCGLYPYGFTTMWSGAPLYAYVANQAINAIADLPGHGTIPSTVTSKKTVITASFFNQLRTALNAVD